MSDWSVGPMLWDGFSKKGLVFPCFRVVPMGWNWAMYWAQRVHQVQALIGSGLSQDRLLVADQPSPSLAGGIPLLIAYADNLNVAGACPSQVQAAKDGAVQRLRALGFGVHEETDACTSADSLGFRLDGVCGVVTPFLKKLGLLRLLSDGCRDGLESAAKQLRNYWVTRYIS